MRAGIVGLLIIVSAACAGAPTRSAPEAYGITERLEEGIVQLTLSIEGIDKRLAQGTAPAVQDSLAELQALDLSAWKLRRQQWVIRRDHLTLAHRMITESKARPDERPHLETAWADHASEYLKQLDDLQKQRDALESRRLKVESELIGRSLR